MTAQNFQKNRNKYKKNLGNFGERAVQQLYIRNGFKLLATNFFNRRGKSFGEIDFVVFKKGHLHFVEVKTRSNYKFGSAIEAVNFVKRQRIMRSAIFFASIYPEFRNCGLHIDLACVEISPFDKRIQNIKITTDAIEGNC